MQAIISCKDAKAQGLKRYFTGKPCKRGNIAERYTYNNMCRCKPCSERHNKSVSKWKEATDFNDKDYQVEYYKNNVDSRKGNTKKWCEENPIQSKAHSKNKNARRRQKMNIVIDDAELFQLCIAESQQQCVDLEDLFGFKFHLDHAIPLNAKEVSGLHCIANFQVIPARINCEKGNKLIFTEPFEWMLYNSQ